ncbi:AfsR/SARP family transcriptional regulator [Saccharomonospora glauca]|uniref:AfsR/SARP family transcriptional regulator n=1 Tax=Saccharomonospora glauca TaxID=40990 RepID=UPI00031A93CC|nr:BTAD domain-containing putative transcriptional regulator [Saccharomonospora glauca]
MPRYGDPVRFGVLGPLAVWTDAGTPVRVREGKVRALLAVLVLNAGGEVPLGRIVEAVWDGAAPADPANTVQTKISQLRRVLRTAEPGADALVARRGGGYVLDVDDTAVDASRFRLLTARAAGVRDPETKAALLGEALTLWRGEPLAEFDQPVLVAEATRLSQRELAAREELARARLDTGTDVTGLAEELAELVARHPLRERLRALHMHALYREGRQEEALAAFTDLRTRLVDELGAEPGPEISRLYEAILRHDPVLGAPPTKTRRSATEHGNTNLPVPLTELIGRDSAVDAVRAALRRSRLVTLTGPGGVGKTRLAVEVGSRERPTTRDGVWLVELAGLERGHTGRPVPDDHVADALAGVLGIRESVGPGGPAMLDQLVDALRDRRVLLVVDNCEAVLDPVAAVVSRLLRALPELRVLATSREPLGVTGELVWEVPRWAFRTGRRRARRTTTPRPCGGPWPSVRCGCSSPAPGPPIPDSRSPRTPWRPSARSAADSTDCRWRWSWRPPACGGWDPTSCCRDWTIDSGCSPVGRGTCRNGSAPYGLSSSGAGGCWRTRSGWCCGGWPCTPAAPGWPRPKLCARARTWPARTWPISWRGWSTGHSSCESPTAPPPDTGCWSRWPPTASTGSPLPGSSMRPASGTPGCTRSWRRRPTTACAVRTNAAGSQSSTSSRPTSTPPWTPCSPRGNGLPPPGWRPP